MSKDYLDMTVREILDELEKMNAGQLAFNGPGPKGDQREPYCCVFANGLENAKKLSLKILKTTDGIPKPAKHKVT